MKKIIIKNALADNSLQGCNTITDMDVELENGRSDLIEDLVEVSGGSLGYEPSSVRKYHFIKERIPRLPAESPEVDRLIAAGKPVVVTNSGLVDSAKQWDLEYLQKHMGNGLNFVFHSKSNKFKYFDDKRAALWPGFARPTSRLELTFATFASTLQKMKHTEERLYLQQILNDTVGKNIVQDFVRFRWDWCTKYQRMCHWGTLTSNLLLVGMEGSVTPCHYDEQENFFAQIKGYKHCVLFPPSEFESLYPYPVSHPCDRQSQVDLDNPDLKKYPKFRNVKACEAVVGPGDVLYIPMYWWHNIESVKSKRSQPESENDVPVTVSVNFWYKASPVNTKLLHSITDQQRVAVMRNIEKMLGEVLKDPKEIGSVLRMIVDGRYTDGAHE